MAFTAADNPHRSAQPMAAMNMTPLIDVLLVLLIMFIITIPIATNMTQVELPSGTAGETNPVVNKIVVTEGGTILWNGEQVTQEQLVTLLDVSGGLDPEPELQFEPEANASYEVPARTLRTIGASQVTKFGFVGNEKYRELSKQ